MSAGDEGGIVIEERADNTSRSNAEAEVAR